MFSVDVWSTQKHLSKSPYTTSILHGPNSAYNSIQVSVKQYTLLSLYSLSIKCVQKDVKGLQLNSNSMQIQKLVPIVHNLRVNSQ